MCRMEVGRFSEIWSWLLLATPEDGGHRAFLGYLHEILERLGRLVESGQGASAEAGVWWRAVEVFARVAESGWWSRRPEVEVDLQPVEQKFVVKVRQDQRRCAAGGVSIPGTGDRVRLVMKTLEALEICLRMRDPEGTGGCLELLAGVAAPAPVSSAPWLELSSRRGLS